MFCEGPQLCLSVDEADEYTWSTGEKTQSIEVGTTGEYSVMVRNNTLECESTDTVAVIVNDACPLLHLISNPTFRCLMKT